MTWGQGENFYTVAAMYNTDWMALWSLNGGDAPDVAQVRRRRTHMVTGFERGNVHNEDGCMRHGGDV